MNLREIYTNKARVSRHASDGDFDDNFDSDFDVVAVVVCTCSFF